MKVFSRLFGKDNPYDQAQRRVNKLFEGNQRGVHFVSVVLLGLISVLLTFLAMRWPEDAPPPIYLPYVLFAVFSFMMPGVAHRMISGERESESLELLLVAPVSAMQVLAAKFRRAFTGILITLAFTLLPVLGWVLAKMISPRPGTYDELLFYVFGSLHLVFFGAVVLSFSLLVSAYSKTNAASLITSLAVLLVTLLVAPILVGLLTAAMSVEYLLSWHPAIQLGMAQESVVPLRGDGADYGALLGWTLLPVPLNTVLAGAMLWFAARRLETERLQGHSISETIHAGS
ncbi:MAG: ABC transporter permease [Fimbriimonadaceae bacterium]